MWNFSTRIIEEAVKKNGVNLGTVVADNITKQLHSDLQSIPVSILISTISQKKKRKEKKISYLYHQKALPARSLTPKHDLLPKRWNMWRWIHIFYNTYIHERAIFYYYYYFADDV